MLFKPCLGLCVSFFEMQGKYECNENKEDNQRDTVLDRADKKYHKRECDKQDDYVQLHCEVIKFHFELHFIVFIQHPGISSEIKVLDV